jgi:hypothetical protein
MEDIEKKINFINSEFDKLSNSDKWDLYDMLPNGTTSTKKDEELYDRFICMLDKHSELIHIHSLLDLPYDEIRVVDILRGIIKENKFIQLNDCRRKAGKNMIN